MNIKPIAHVRTCYEEKFGVPRQSGLVGEAWGQLVFEPEYRQLDAIRGLDEFSHLWLVFIFHHTSHKEWKPTVRPPRLGGNQKVGVFASRSPFRPNPIGLSCLKIEKIDLLDPLAPIIHLSGVDVVDGTPVIDIKPYVPYADCLPNASEGFAQGPPPPLALHWQNDMDANIDTATKRLIEKSLSMDPRPAYQNDDQQREYGCLINGLNVRWTVQNNTVLILSCSCASST